MLKTQPLIMKKKFILLFSISLCCFVKAVAQVKDSLSVEERERAEKLKPNNSYGLRVGTDVYKLYRSIAFDNYTGFEIAGDYRLTRKWYAATELGNEKFSVEESSISTNTSGSYIKLGGDYNVFKNLIGMRNLIFVGFRYGFSTFSQELDSFTVATTDSFFESQVRESDLSSDGLTAHWMEALVGMKAEVLNNLFLGFTVAVNRKVAEKQPDGFDNLYIPGFGTTNDFSDFGVGFRYYISYYIPLYKINYKPKKKKDKKKKNEKNKEKADIEN